MHRRAIAAALIIGFAGVACDAGSKTGTGLERSGGRVVVARVSARSSGVVSDPGQASYCAAESLLVVVVIGRSWIGGIAAKVVLPIIHTDTLVVQGALGGPGSATAAFRRLPGGSAELGVGGSLVLVPGHAVSGQLDVAAPDSGGVHVRFRGRLSDVPVRELPKGSCGT